MKKALKIIGVGIALCFVYFLLDTYLYSKFYGQFASTFRWLTIFGFALAISSDCSLHDKSRMGLKRRCFQHSIRKQIFMKSPMKRR